MKWRQRVRIMTGLSCTQIVLNLAAIGLLVTGWLTDKLVQAGSGLFVFYGLCFLLMFVFQRQSSQRLRDMGDFFEELTTSWYCAASLMALWLLSKVVHHHVLLAVIGVVILAGPALVSLLAKDQKTASGDFPPEQNERR